MILLAASIASGWKNRATRTRLKYQANLRLQPLRIHPSSHLCKRESQLAALLRYSHLQNSRSKKLQHHLTSHLSLNKRRHQSLLLGLTFSSPRLRSIIPQMVNPLLPLNKLSKLSKSRCPTSNLSKNPRKSFRIPYLSRESILIQISSFPSTMRFALPTR